MHYVDFVIKVSKVHSLVSLAPNLYSILNTLFKRIVYKFSQFTLQGHFLQ